LLKDGINAPLNWYRVRVDGLAAEDDKRLSIVITYVASATRLTIPSLLLVIPADRYDIDQPVFFGGCTRDYVCLPTLGQANLSKHCKNATYKEFDADHWVMLSHADEVNKELLAWIEDKV
jgi:pimeloyl-ACP methyl ester carboxylesterase